MKNIIKIIMLLFTLGAFLNVKAQVDDYTYIKQFEIDKADYVDKPFSYLLSHMIQIRPQTVNSLARVWGKDLTPYSSFNFDEIDRQYGAQTLEIIITWKTPISYTQAFILCKQNRFLFTNAEEVFYGDKIVGDINVYYR